MSAPRGRLRVLHVVVQPVLVWDLEDDDELRPGPPIEPVRLAVSELADLAAVIREQTAQLEAQLREAEQVSPLTQDIDGQP